jgi:hypothetical protein
MIDRRTMIKSAAMTFAGAPALPAAARRLSGLGKSPIHTEAEFRAAFELYITHFTAFFTPYTEPDFMDDYGANKQECDTFEDHRGRLCRAWFDAKQRLLEMTMENNGYDPNESCPGIASVSVDLGDVSFVVAGDPDCEGQAGGGSIVVILPRTQAMFDRLDTLPTWEKPPGRHFYPPIDPDDYQLIEDEDD